MYFYFSIPKIGHYKIPMRVSLYVYTFFSVFIVFNVKT